MSKISNPKIKWNFPVIFKPYWIKVTAPAKTAIRKDFSFYIIPAKITLAIRPANVENNAPPNVNLVFVTLAAI